MGKVAGKRPAKLASKLLAIREGLGLSQSELIQKLRLEGELTQSQISAFERGSRTPSLNTILQYARFAKISTDVLIDDDLRL